MFKNRIVVYIHRTRIVMRLLEFVSNWVLNKYVRLFVGFVTVIITRFQLVIKLDSIEEFKGHSDYKNGIFLLLICVLLLLTSPQLNC